MSRTQASAEPPGQSRPRGGASGGRVAAALAALLAVVVGWLGLWTCDDAYISFRYARHLAEGHGLVFNLGETPPIEGFSNLLWVLVLSLFERLGAASPGVAHVLSLAAFGWLARTVTADLGALTSLRPAHRLALVLAGLVTLPPMVVWSTSGLETMAFTLALYGAGRGLTSLGGPRSLVFWSVCTVALRVDGGVYLAALVAAGFAASLVWPSSVERRRLVTLLVATVLAIALITVFRKLYFGYWSPHTARVKVDPSAIVFERGLRYVLSMLVGSPGLLLLVVAGGWGTLRRLRSEFNVERGLVALFAVPFVVGLVLSIAAGGDFMAFARFFVPAVPFLVVLVALAFDARERTPRGTPLLVTAVAITALNGAALFDRLPLPTAVQEQLHFRWNNPAFLSEATVWRNMDDRAIEWAHLGRALAEHTEPGETLVRGAIGAVGYYSELVLLDTYGLVDPDVAAREGNPGAHSPGHDKQVPDAYFLDRNPDYFTYTDLVPESDRLQGIPPELADQAFLSELFRVEYLPVAEHPETLLRLVRYTGGAPSGE